MGSPGVIDEHSSSSNNKTSSCSSSLRLSSSSSSSTATARSCPSSLLLSTSSPTSTDPPSSLRSMDDLWQDINLSSLHQPAAASSAVHGDAILQNFLGGGVDGRPFNEAPTTSPSKYAYGPEPSSSSMGLTSGSGARNREKKSPIRATSQACGHHASGEESPGCNVCMMKPPSDVHITPSVAAVAAASPPPLKRKSSTENNGDSSDRRFQRLMKNRESAERSRARKQAYMMELETEVERLHEENDMLRREQEKFLAAAAAAQVPKRRSLRRTFTSPF